MEGRWGIANRGHGPPLYSSIHPHGCMRCPPHANAGPFALGCPRYRLLLTVTLKQGKGAADGLPTEVAWEGSDGLQIVATARPSIAPFIHMTACDAHPMHMPVLSRSGALGIAICLT